MKRHTKSWRVFRESVIARQGGACRSCGKTKPVLDVVKWGRKVDFSALCRSCRLKHDAPVRIPKAIATRRRRRNERQISLPLGVAA